MPKTYAPPAISELARSAPPAIARYQLRLKRRKGRTAAKVLASSCFMRMPLKNASGSQIREQMEFQKLSRTLRRLTKASTRSKRVLGSWPGRWVSFSAGAALAAADRTSGSEPMSSSLSCSTEAGTSISRSSNASDDALNCYSYRNDSPGTMADDLYGPRHRKII